MAILPLYSLCLGALCLCSLHLSGARLVDLICVAWGRTIDVGGYQELALGNPKVLGEPERALVHERLGILFAFDPECPDGTWRMNLALEEDHRVAEMLVTLAVKEDGENWYEKRRFGPRLTYK